MSQNRKSHRRTIVTDRRLKFAAVGVANTATDFIFFNILAAVMGVPPILANICSTGIAMGQSFVFNKFFVFQSRGGNRWQQGALFLLVTITAMWGVQSIVIWILHAPADWFAARLIASPELASALALNGTKAAATVASLIWNYAFYRSVVFKKGDS